MRLRVTPPISSPHCSVTTFTTQSTAAGVLPNTTVTADTASGKKLSLTMI